MNESKTLNEVDDLYDIINNKTTGNNTIYDELKKKEMTYYETIQKVIDEKDKERNQPKDIQSKPFIELMISAMAAWYDIVMDLVNYDYRSKYTKDTFFVLLTKDDRPIYIGILLVILSIFMMIIFLSTNT
jgi:DNA gyrase/topoisomerase IV subunit A